MLLKRNLWIIIAILFYLFFFYKTLDKNMYMYSGKDSVNLHYPSKVFLYENLKKGVYPFFTKEIFEGFEIYLDLERGYLNPINLILIYTFGPFDSYKILHFFTYLLGFYSLWKLFEKRGFSSLGKIAGCLVYFYGFIMLYHQAHFNMVMTFYLIPTALLFLEKKKYVYLALLLFHLVTFGSFQAIYILGIFCGFYTLYFGFSKEIYKTILISVLLLFPIFIEFIPFVLHSTRPFTTDMYKEGGFTPIYLTNLFVPLLFDQGNAYSMNYIENEYYEHEFYIYSSFIAIILGLLGLSFLDKKDKKLMLTILVLSILFSLSKYINMSFFPGFSLFRYWPRALIMFSLALSFGSASFITNYTQALKPKIAYIFFGGLLLLNLFSLNIQLTKDLMFLITGSNFAQSACLIIFIILIIGTFGILVFKFDKRILFILLLVDILLFGQFVTRDDFKPKSEIVNRSAKLADYSQFEPVEPFRDYYDPSKFLINMKLSAFGLYLYYIWNKRHI